VKLPFEIDRSRPVRLVDQLVGGLRSAIRDGSYPVGSTLPRLKDLAAACGVSMIVARMAYRRLSEEGLVRSREHMGTVVLGGGDNRWRGHVLIVLCEYRPNDYHGNVVALMTEELTKANYLVTQTFVVGDREKAPDYTTLDVMLETPLSLVFVADDRWNVAARAAKRNIPTFVLGGRTSAAGPRHSFALWDAEAAIPDFARWCVASGVRSVAEVWMSREDTYAMPGRELRRAGIACRRWSVPRGPGYGTFEQFHTGVQAFFDARLKRKNVVLPDVLYFNDDHVCVAALQALEAHRIRIPDDVRIVSWSNRGGGPFSRYSLGLVQMDPFADGRKVTEAVLRQLGGKKATGDLSLKSIFLPDRPGEASCQRGRARLQRKENTKT